MQDLPEASPGTVYRRTEIQDGEGRESNSEEEIERMICKKRRGAKAPLSIPLSLRT